MFPTKRPIKSKLRRRASAPPLGDMAVGSMVLHNRGFINLNGPNISVTLRDVSAKQALISLAKLGGYGFIFVPSDDKEKTI